ncbi:ATP-binding protein [Geodermatophilus sp. SYSU D00815]
MSRPLWRRARPPRLRTVIFTGEVATPADLTIGRGRLHREVLRRTPPAAAGEGDVDRLLLTFEELASNGLRHGRPPVRVTVSQDDDGWLVDVTDAAAERSPTPAVGRDPAHGGLGLYLVARLSAAHGWWDEAGRRKHVWAFVRSALS